MSRREGQVRPTRGGQDQFKWEDAVNDKFRDNYLGAGLHVPKKKTFNNPHPNALWYLDKNNEAAASKDEIKAREERLMLQAMGLLPKEAPGPTEKLDKEEYGRLVARGATARDEFDSSDRVRGVGFGDAPKHEAVKEVLKSMPSANEPRGEEKGQWMQERSSSDKDEHRKDKKDKKHKDKKDKRYKDKDKDRKRKEKHRDGIDDDRPSRRPASPDAGRERKREEPERRHEGGRQKSIESRPADAALSPKRGRDEGTQRSLDAPEPKRQKLQESDDRGRDRNYLGRDPSPRRRDYRDRSSSRDRDYRRRSPSPRRHSHRYSRSPDRYR